MSVLFACVPGGIIFHNLSLFLSVFQEEADSSSLHLNAEIQVCASVTPPIDTDTESEPVSTLKSRGIEAQDILNQVNVKV